MKLRPPKMKRASTAPVPPTQTPTPTSAATKKSTDSALSAAYGQEFVVDLQRRRDQLVARVAELQWDMGGLVYEMAVRNSIRVEVMVKRAVILQDADAELNEVERILRMEETGTAGSCGSCRAPHSSGATFCWQCGHSLLQQVSGETIVRS